MTNAYKTATTVENLEKLKQQWKQVSKQYARIFAFNIGEIKDKFLRLRLNNWPSVNNAIENFITDNEVTTETIKNFGSSAKGLPGIEYLIFSESNAIVNTKMKNDSKRLAYLLLIVDELYNNAKLQQELWNTYSIFLINNNDTGVKNSFNVLFNGLNNVIHFTAETKIGKPAGFIKTSGVNTEILQAYFSKTSLEIIKANVESVQELFFNTDIISISDKIDFVRKDNVLSNKLKDQFTNVFTAINAIKNPLVNSLNNVNNA